MGARCMCESLSRGALVSDLASIPDVNLDGFTINYSAKDHQGSSYTDLTIIGRCGKFMH